MTLFDGVPFTSPISEKFVKLFSEANQAHHDADAVCKIGGQLITKNPEAMQQISEDIIEAMESAYEEHVGDGKLDLSKIPGGAVQFQFQRNLDVFSYGLASHNIVMHHSIFDGMLSDLLGWIADEQPALFEDEIKNKTLKVSELQNLNPDQIMEPVINKYLADLCRQSIFKKMDAICRIIKGPLPTLKPMVIEGYTREDVKLKDIDDRRHEIIHNPLQRVNVTDRHEIADYMRNSSIAFGVYVFTKLAESDPAKI